MRAASGVNFGERAHVEHDERGDCARGLEHTQVNFVRYICYEDIWKSVSRMPATERGFLGMTKRVTQASDT